MDIVGYVLIRMVLWTAALAVSLFPTLHATPGIGFDLVENAMRVNERGLFRDLFFVIAPTSALALSTVTDFLITHYARSSGLAQIACVLCLPLNVAALVSGFVGFLVIPPGDHPLDPGSFGTAFGLLVFAVGFSALTEIGMSSVARTHG